MYLVITGKSFNYGVCFLIIYKFLLTIQIIKKLYINLVRTLFFNKHLE